MELHYLPLWPVILLKDSIICIDCAICHQHYSLATLTAPPSLIKLETERKRHTAFLHINKHCFSHIKGC